MRSTAILLSTAACVMALPAAAQEQTSPTTTNAAVDGQASTAGAQAGDTQELGAGDIVVTATRRSERLADVPISINAVSQEALQNSGATDIRQMTQLAPSLQVSSTGSEANASARIRGVGTVGDNPGLESSVAVFIDGVYRSRTGSGLNDLGEVDRIEVLRGPQGTLSGRNSSAGAINVYTKAPSMDFGGYAEATYGNYDAVRVAGAVTGPIVADKLAFRIDGLFSKRDGFLYDVVNNTDYNNRNRYFVRGQLLLEASPDFSVRLIGDYTHRDEKCCGAVFIDVSQKYDPTPGVPGDFAYAQNNFIVNVQNAIAGTPTNVTFASAGNPYNRRIANSTGRAYANVTEDYGGSAQVDWNLGGAALTSITAYREYKAGGAADIDYGRLDIGYRADDGNSYRQFKTFTQELRLNGELFGDRLNWLVGGYYSHEKLAVVDNLKFGSQYGQFAACRFAATLGYNIATALNPASQANGAGIPALIAPGSAGCLSQAGRATFANQFGTATVNGLDVLSTLNNLGSQRDEYRQTSENYAFFTHNIFKLTDTLSITGGLRWTHESKDLNASFTNNNTVCPTQFGTVGGLLASPNATLRSIAGNLLTLSCTGNSSAALNGKSISNSFSESEFTGTGVLSWKPVDRVMVYASYARGYKAGGYNLDRSDLGPAFLPTTTANPNAALLRFDPETVNAYEVGLKYASRKFTFNVSGFRSDFQNFQLNTFNGTNFVVQNIGSCSATLNGADRDASAATGTCTAKVGTGMRTQGVEMEAGFYPARTLAINLGYTLADTKFRNDLVGSRSGEALDPALFLLPGAQISNAPRNVVTSSIAWTPDIGSSGLSALFYVDQRTSSDYNTGSDLFVEKAQDGFTIVNARIGLRGADDRWAIEAFAQNLFDTNYQQVAFNAPFQGSGSIAQVRAFGGVGNQIFSSYLGEPRTYGLTVRTRF